MRTHAEIQAEHIKACNDRVARRIAARRAREDFEDRWLHAGNIATGILLGALVGVITAAMAIQP